MVAQQCRRRYWRIVMMRLRRNGGIMYRNNYRTPQMTSHYRSNCGGGKGGEQMLSRRNEPGGGCGCEREERNCGCEREERSCSREREERSCGCEKEERGCGCEKEERSCGCERDTVMDCDCMPSHKDEIACMALAMAYVPWQDFKKLYCEEEAWRKGTIFEQMDLDFKAGRCN